jgi:NAD-dependent SIR2 family protein deacetylase
VYPAATLPEVTLDAGGRLAIVNYTPTHLDHFATFISREPAAVLLGEAQALVSAATPRY